VGRNPAGFADGGAVSFKIARQLPLKDPEILQRYLGERPAGTPKYSANTSGACGRISRWTSNVLNSLASQPSKQITNS
jgi:hypothetical protein